MKKYTKFGIIFLTTLLTLSSLTTMTFGDTKIEDSSFPADEGDFYKLICTYSHPTYIGFTEKGSWWNITIERIYQGSYLAVSNALIVNATVGQYVKGMNFTSYINDPFYLVYNKSLNFIDLDSLFILPIPLNLTMVASFIELNWGKNCTINGNTLIVDWGLGTGIIQKYNYDSHGFATSLIQEINGTKYLEYSLISAGGQDIPFGNYFIIPSIISIGLIVIFMMKRFKIKL